MKYFFTLLLLLTLWSAGAQKTDSLIALLPGHEGKEKLTLYRSILGHYITGTYKPDLKYYLEAVQEARTQGDRDFEGMFEMYGAIIYDELGDFDSALLCGRRALRLMNETNNVLWASGMARTMAQINSGLLQYDSALHYALMAVEYHYRQELNPGRYQAFATVALTYEHMKNVPKAIEWNQRLLQLAVENGEDFYVSLAHDYMGNVYDISGQLDSALYHKRMAMATSGDSEEHIRIIGNLGNTFLKQGQLDSARYYTEMAYGMLQDENLPYWLRSREGPRLTINLGAILYRQGSDAAAHAYLKEGLQKAIDASFNEKIMEAHYWLYELTKRQGKHQQALGHFEAYQLLQDSAQNIERKKEMERLTVVYETEKKEQQMKVLKAETEVSQLQVARTQNLLVGIVVVAVLLLMGIVLYNSRMRYKLKAQLAEEREQLQKTRFRAVIEAEENERKRIARELHDGLGQLLSTARITISSLDEEETNKKVQNSMKLIDHAVQEVRSISHNMMPNALVALGIEAALDDLVHTLNQAGKLRINFTKNTGLHLDETRSISVYRVVQEVLNNAIRYSGASEITIALEATTAGYQLSISDNGQGFDTAAIAESKGIGWKNIHSRMELIDGQVQVFSRKGEGTTVRLGFGVRSRQEVG